MNQYIDIILIKGDWYGMHHGTYPKRLSVNPSLDEPFAVSEGWGHGLCGGYFTLEELVEGEFIKIFDRVESLTVFNKIMSAYENKMDGKKLAVELLSEYGENA